MCFLRDDREQLAGAYFQVFVKTIQAPCPHFSMSFSCAYVYGGRGWEIWLVIYGWTDVKFKVLSTSFFNQILLANVVVVSGLQQSVLALHIRISILLSHFGYYRTLSRPPCAKLKRSQNLEMIAQLQKEKPEMHSFIHLFAQKLLPMCQAGSDAGLQQ